MNNETVEKKSFFAKTGAFIVKNKKKVAVLVIALVVVGVGIFAGTTFANPNLDGEMNKVVDSFYNDRIRGKVIGIKKQLVTLSALDKAGYDVSALKNAGCNMDNTFAYVVLEDPNETEFDKIKYTIEITLACE